MDMRDRRSLRWGWMAGFLGIVSLWVLGVQPAQAWQFLPKEGVFVYPGIDGVGYLTTESPQGIGRVVTVKAEKAVNIGEGDVVYLDVGTRQGIKVGDRLAAFSLYKPRELRNVRVVIMEARLQVTQVKEEESEAIVEDSYVATHMGSRVDRYVPRDRTIPLKLAPPSVTGQIVWSYENLVSIGDGDVVFLDRGSADGVEPGQCYQFYRVPMEEVEIAAPGGKKGGPRKDHISTGVGEMVILRAEQNTASALVRKSLLPLGVGERFRAGCAWEEAAKKAAAAPPGTLSPAGDDTMRKARDAFENRDVLYAYDSYVLSDAAKALLQAKAVFLKGQPEIQVLIEGHCDERGTREYNLGLGDRRAHAARQYMMGLGISGDRMKTVSYGKERPIDPGHNEEAWSKNRRAHFAIDTR